MAEASKTLTTPECIWKNKNKKKKKHATPNAIEDAQDHLLDSTMNKMQMQKAVDREMGEIHEAIPNSENSPSPRKCPTRVDGGHRKYGLCHSEQ